MKIMFICMGNVCRSPLAEALFTYHVRRRGLQDVFHIDSAGTRPNPVAEPPDPGSQRVAKERLNVDISHQHSKRLSREHVEEFDVLVAMDRPIRRQAMRLSDTRMIHLLRDFEPEDGHPLDVPDPWGGGDDQFESVYDIVYRCTDALLDRIVNNYDIVANDEKRAV